MVNNNLKRLHNFGYSHDIMKNKLIIILSKNFIPYKYVCEIVFNN